jgi:peptidoglycan hydrolase FlgJ
MMPSAVGDTRDAGTAAIGADPRLKPAAHEFEACLMKEFLEPLQHDALFAGEDKGGGDQGGEGSGSALMSFGAEALARAISERGGFGIAAKIIDHFGKGSSAARSGV